MSVPTQEQNGVFTHVYPIEDLGFTPVSSSDSSITIAASGSANGTVFGTGVPATVLIMSRLSAGSGNLKVCVGASGFTPNYGSPTATLAVSGTAFQMVTVNTGLVFDDSNSATTTISSDTRFVGIQLSSTGGMTVDRLAVLVCYELTPGEDWRLGIRGSANAVANRTVGDGGGLISFLPAFALNPYLNPNLKL